MKKVSLIVAMVFVVAACNLSEKFKKASSSNSNSSSSSSNPSKIGNDSVEQPNPTAAQTAAIANGQTVKWDQQGITWTLPANWKKQDVRNETLSYGGGSAVFSVVGLVMPKVEKFTDVSLKTLYEGRK